MDWFKIKTQHVLDSELSDAEVGQLVRYQAKIAFYERPLSDKEYNATFSPKKLQKITKFLSEKYEICFKKVAKKVLEDVEKSLKKNEKARERVKRFRLKLQEKDDENNADVTRNTSVSCNADVTALDKIREDKSINNYYDTMLMSSSSFLEIFKDEVFLAGPIEYCQDNYAFCLKIANLKADEMKSFKSNRDSYIASMINGMQGLYKKHEIASLIKQGRNLAENKVLEKENKRIKAKELMDAREQESRRLEQSKNNEKAYNSLSEKEREEILNNALKAVLIDAPMMKGTLSVDSKIVQKQAMYLIGERIASQQTT